MLQIAQAPIFTDPKTFFWFLSKQEIASFGADKKNPSIFTLNFALCQKYGLAQNFPHSPFSMSHPPLWSPPASKLPFPYRFRSPPLSTLLFSLSLSISKSPVRFSLLQNRFETWGIRLVQVWLNWPLLALAWTLPLFCRANWNGTRVRVTALRKKPIHSPCSKFRLKIIKIGM